MSEEINKESLHKSITLVGELYPILENQDGKILDGNTRAASNPKHHRKTIQTKSRTEEILIRVHAHHRRRISQEETRTILLELAGEFLKSGVVTEKVAQEVVKVVPYSEGYVLELLPSEFKEGRKVEAGKVSAQLTEQKKAGQTVTIPDRGQPIRVMASSDLLECDGCKMATHITKLATLNGEDLCPICYQRRLKFPKAELKSPEPNSKPVESWEQRKAVMSPGVSKMDEAVFSALQTDKTLRDSGWHFKFQEHYCIKEVVSDVTAMKGDVEKPLFLDGDVHFGKEDRDEANRDLLRRRLGISDVLAFAYTGAYSEVKRDEIVTKIRESLKF